MFTAIKFAIYKAKSIAIKDCVINVDQPLYMKAQDIIVAISLANELTAIIKLGAFHIMLSFFCMRW